MAEATPGSETQPPVGSNLVFLVGARRSGTHWLERILSAHPLIDAVPSETHLISHGVAPLLERFHHGVQASHQVGSTYIGRKELIESIRQLCDAALMQHLRSDSGLLVERTPLHAGHLELISEIYPASRIIHIIRDGRDVARSLLRRSWGPDSITEAAQEWQVAVSSARAAAPGSDRYRELRYEDLLADPEREIASLFKWLGTESVASASVLEEAGVVVNTGARKDDVRAERWRSEMSPADLRSVESEVGELLEELGYERAATNVQPSLINRAGRFVGRLLPRGQTPALPDDDEIPASQMNRQEMVDQLLGALEGGDSSAVSELLDAACRIEISGHAREPGSRGETGLKGLQDALAQGWFQGVRIDSQGWPSQPTSFAEVTIKDDRHLWLYRIAATTGGGKRIADLSIRRSALPD